MNTMRAMSQRSLGGPEVLQEIELPRPVPGHGEILIRVHAIGVNPTDWQHRSMGIFLGEPPFTVGWDVSGTVMDTGLGVSIFTKGDEVFGMLPYPSDAGAYAEYVAAPARAFALKPRTLTHVEAAALPMVSLVAWQALVDTAHVQTGQRVLVQAAAGGIGHVGVQVAKALGAYVIATASGDEKIALAHKLGADEVIDYRNINVADAAHDVDVVLDTVGGETRARSLQTLKSGGILVSSIPSNVEELDAAARRLGVRARTLIVEHDRGALTAIAELADGGLLRPHVWKTYPLSKAGAAHADGEAGRVIGKIVLTNATEDNE